jgi:hypothetical protein
MPARSRVTDVGDRDIGGGGTLRMNGKRSQECDEDEHESHRNEYALAREVVYATNDAERGLKT